MDRPLPLPDADSAPFWEACRRGELRAQRCAGCGTLRHPPRPMCGACRSMDMGLAESRGQGTVYSFTVIRHPQFPGYDFPIVAAVIDLEEGVRMVSNVVECDPADVHIGMPVEGFIHEDEDGFKLPLFRPVS